MTNYLEKVSPNQFVIHTSKKRFRNDILKYGIRPNLGDSYKDNWPKYEWGEITPAIFVTNSSKISKAYGYDYRNEGKLDFWLINTKQLDNVWYEDPNMGEDSILTFNHINPKAIKLINI